MAYTSPSDVRRAMKNLPTSVLDEELEVYIAKAEAYIDGLLGGVFAVPFSDIDTPPLIKYLATDMAVYFLAENLYSSQRPNLDENFKERWERIQEMIDKIISGELAIGVARKPEPTNQAGFATTNKVGNIFTLEDPYW